MAFALSGINRVSAGANTNAPALMSYYTASNTGAQVAAAGYFDDFVENLRVGTIILVRASDGIGFYSVTAVTPTVTTSALATIGVGGVGSAQLQAGAVDNAALSANAVDTGKLALNTIQYAQVAMTAAEWNGMYATPKQIIAAPGAGKIIQVDAAWYDMTFVAAQYAAGGVVNLQYDSTANGAGVLATQDTAAATITGLAASSIVRPAIGITAIAQATTVNKGLYMSNKTAAFTTGDGTWKINVAYRIITA